MPSFISYPSLRRDASLWIGILAFALVFEVVAPQCQADETNPPAATEGDALDQALNKPAEDPPADEAETEVPFAERKTPPPRPFLEPPKGAKPLTKDGRAWIDHEKKLVMVDGRIVLNRGLLEMFACPRNTKEHESIVAVYCKAFVIHAGLLAVGAETGTPVQFGETVIPPTGTEIDIFVEWKDKDGKMQRVKAQTWMRDANTQQEMDLPWVFAGSMFVQNEVNGTAQYLAEDGDLVCVANFGSAMLDVPAEVSNNNGSLLFECIPDRIPALGWPVRLVFDPVLKEETKADDKKSAPTAKETEPQKTEPATAGDQGKS